MEKGCYNCRYKDRTELQMPCVNCIRNAVDKWEPEQDVVEVVRCKDCEYYGTDGCVMDTYWVDVTEESFCSYGKRRRDD